MYKKNLEMKTQTIRLYIEKSSEDKNQDQKFIFVYFFLYFMLSTCIHMLQKKFFFALLSFPSHSSSHVALDC